ncbi:hypothetical protein SAMN04488540_11175 [Ferrimonas sediminum]|uniref:Uncharacterized protein n=1 Tax=Ferrimonas sediminum TaxID=718193 RepID=A0A1G8VK15_9GAMM|nr:hypothetical protein [Ferrimonas sediminum]SDJ66456.1 hypothetical protein SAMN04488540_11175 [Ferrimonas sediminum]
MRRWSVLLAAVVPIVAMAKEPCARVQISSDYGGYDIGLISGEPEVIELGNGGRLVFMALTQENSAGIKVSTEMLSGSNRLSTSIFVSPDRPSSLRLAGVQVDVSAVDGKE